jgi:multidrug efflux pump subunit AcrA (membrane-fusion protein)
METTKLDLNLQTDRSEEVQHIIERMPHRFGYWISMIVLFLFVLMGLFGWLVRYPDIVKGQIILNANVAPLKLVANSNGKLKLNQVKSLQEVKEGQMIAYLENSSNPENVDFIKGLIGRYNPSSDTVIELYPKLPKNFSLGELNVKYYAFTAALQQFISFKEDHLYDKQGQSLKEIFLEQQKAKLLAESRIAMAMNSLGYAHKFYSRDSTLFSRKVISEAELDKTQMNYISSKDAYQNSLNNLTSAKQQLQQTEAKLQELGITKPEKEKELRIALISSYNELIDSIKTWQQKYVFIAPFTGKVQFLKFYSEHQFVQNGEQVFTIIPKQDHILGQVILPAQGSGKIKEGQEVIVKLDNFPYNEYGSVTGRVKSISLTTSTTKTEKSDIETYQVLVDFPNQLKTNYGTNLFFKAEAKGSAEVITNDRRLIQRLFDNLRYIIEK